MHISLKFIFSLYKINQNWFHFKILRIVEKLEVTFRKKTYPVLTTIIRIFLNSLHSEWIIFV